MRHHQKGPMDHVKQAARVLGTAGNGPRAGGDGGPAHRHKLSERASDKNFARGTKVHSANLIDAPVMRGGIRF